MHPDNARELKARILALLRDRPVARSAGLSPWVAVGLAPGGGGRARGAVLVEDPAYRVLLPDLVLSATDIEWRMIGQ